ncbi:response regulator [Luteimonas sp. SJ-92]|uniref:Response regulator n=1 Tax=Luteimonas salinisoli TaxID=2752307 RepID=A0A853J8B0_9GAMM|nr:response regulator [Luteimonas salinisoli]NZA24939.1 response regulator [Luteimonas salinisoli]
MPQTRIAIVDDDHDIREPLARYFARCGYRVDTAANGAELDRLLSGSTFDLLVLDIMLPGEDGLAICRRLQGKAPMPIILLTAVADDTDRIIGLELGADDYVCKPFNPRELLARVKSVLRRTAMLPPRQVRRKGRVRFDRWRFDFSGREVFGPDGVGIRLSAGEHLMLTTLIEHAGMTLTRDQLLDLTRGRDVQLFDRSIDMQISRLRRKLEADHKAPRIIVTDWGGGYLFAANVEWCE